MTSKIVLRSSDSRKVVFVSIATVAIISLIAAISFCWLNPNPDVTPAPTSQGLRIHSANELEDEVPFGLTEDQDRARHKSTAKSEDHQRRAVVQPVKIRSQSKSVNSDAESAGSQDNFRPEIGNARDLKPEYEFEAFGRRFHMVLSQDAVFMRPDLKITFVSTNSSTQQQLDINPRCYFSGSLKDESASFVVVNLCNGMRGSILSSKDGAYSIEPTDSSNNNASAFDHILRRIDSNDETSSDNRNNCGTKTDPEQSITGRNSAELVPKNSVDHRVKRSVPEDFREYTVELLIAVDRRVAQSHGAGLQEFILILLAQVNQIFKDNSIDNSINVVLVKWVVLENDSAIRDYGHRNTVMLDKFCEWQYKINDHDDSSPDHHDVAILITRDMICSYDRDECNSFLGLAQLGHVCSKDNKKSCGAVKDTGLNTAFTIAHELGHILNIPHDEDAKCTNHRISNESIKIMTEKAGSNADPWSWSACSRYFISEFLGAGDVECLLDNPLKSYAINTLNNPGEIYSADKQCEMTYGEGFQMIPIGANCSVLWCYHPRTHPHPKSESFPWADGTECGVNHWCRRKRCVPRSHPVQKVDGGWSDWQPFSECTRTCGGGVRISRRACNNPKNSNGGKYCSGSKVRLESCNHHDCPPDTPDFRSQQCAKFNNRTTRWIPHFRKRSERDERCILVCKETITEKVQSFNEYVIDGTFCDKDSNYGVCVNGKCLKTGCDHKLHSNLAFDNCGVCGGNNSSCKVVRKVFNQQSASGYTFIDEIPANASSIDIREVSRHGPQDNNSLALKDRSGHGILNYDYSLSKFELELSFEGVTIEYSGTEANPEHIKISNRLPKPLILEVLSSSTAPPFDVYCQYILPMAAADYYKWEVIDDWTACDKVCNGEQEKIIRCIKKETGNVIPSESCADLPKRQTEKRLCNDFCTLSWKTVGQTECSTWCGQGTRKLTYRCYRENHTNDIATPPSELSDVYCAHIVKPPEQETCSGPCISAHWRYGEWEPCSVTCGKGIQRRQAMCVDDYDRQVDDSACKREEKSTESACYMDKCPQWSLGDWSPCSVTCGRGVRKRQVLCKQNNRIVSFEYCRNQHKPGTLESCEMPECAFWLTGEWSQCSVTCGAGSMVRDIRCSAPDERECSRDRPAETQYCFLPSCIDSNNIASSNDVLFTNDEKQEFQWRYGNWSECSKTCGKGTRQRIQKCYKMSTGTVADEELCATNAIPQDKTPLIEPCEERSCPQWRTSAWSPCTVTCGRGLIERRVWCEVDGTRVDERECKEIKPVELRTCQKSHCPTTTTEASSEAATIPMSSSWRVGRWGECSVKCGGGMKTRNVLCLDNAGNIASGCLDHFRPASSSPCHTNPCADQVKWKYGEWSQCNQTCGGGYQRRQAQCTSTTGESMPESYCGLPERSQLMRPCENTPCSKIVYQWQTASWSECSVTCGTGVHTRVVRCNKIDEYNPQMMEPVSDSFCDVVRPITEKKCQKTSCETAKYSYHWRSGPWSECSATCGSGLRKRWIDCQRISNEKAEDAEVVPDRFCDKASRPPHHQGCQLVSCPDKFFWVAGSWGECTGPCGNKKRKRKLYCYRNFETVHPSRCRHLGKPKRRHRCPQHKCEPVTCLDIKEKFHTVDDGEYTLNILGRNISIYCHEMWSSHPKEYLSLNAGATENYSEYYAKRLRDPDSCPHKGLRSTRSSSTKEDYNSLASLEEDNSFAGKTVFRKLRLNVTSMQVLMNDYAFASSDGYSIPIGQAGDCYSKRDCARGTFSINVSGTGLRIASAVQWEIVGSHSTMDVRFSNERRKVVGTCGGYCAMCRPVRGLKLDVLPP